MFADSPNNCYRHLVGVSLVRGQWGSLFYLALRIVQHTFAAAVNDARGFGSTRTGNVGRHV
jgi:hypothetical protein